MVAPVSAQEAESGLAPETYGRTIMSPNFPWADESDDKLQFRSYHDYFSLKERMQFLADRNPYFLEFHEGLLGGVNARGDEMASTEYEVVLQPRKPLDENHR